MSDELELLKLKAKAKLKVQKEKALLSKDPSISIKEPVGVYTPEGAKEYKRQTQLMETAGVTEPPGLGTSIVAGLTTGAGRPAGGLGSRLAQKVAAQDPEKSWLGMGMPEEQTSAMMQLAEEAHPKAFGRSELGGQMGAQAAIDAYAGFTPKGTLGKVGKGVSEGAMYGMSMPYETKAEMVKNMITHGISSGAITAAMQPVGKVIKAGGKKLSNTKPAQIISAKTKAVFDRLSKKFGKKADVEAFKALKPTKSDIKKLDKLPGGAPFIDDAGEVVSDKKLREIGRTMLDEGVIDDKALPSKPQTMKNQVIRKLKEWGTKKQIMLDKHGQTKLINKNQLADMLDEKIGAEMIEDEGDKVMQRHYRQFKAQVDALRQMPSDEGGFITWKQADDKLRKWGNKFYKDGVLKDMYEGADEVRIALKNTTQEALEKLDIGDRVAEVNNKYHNLKLIKGYVDNLAAGDMTAMSHIEQMVGYTAIGAAGTASLLQRNPALVVGVAGVIGLRNFQKRYGNQALAKTWSAYSKDLSKVGGADFARIIADKASNPRSAILAHALLYKKNKQYRDMVTALNKEKKEDDGEKKPYDDIVKKDYSNFGFQGR
jgi:hypothetical protein